MDLLQLLQLLTLCFAHHALGKLYSKQSSQQARSAQWTPQSGMQSGQEALQSKARCQGLDDSNQLLQQALDLVRLTPCLTYCLLSQLYIRKCMRQAELEK